MKNKSYDAIIIIIGILLIIFLFLFLTIIATKYEFLPIYIIGYLFLVFFIGFLDGKFPKTKPINWLFHLLSIPFYIIQVTLPIITIFLYTIIFILFSCTIPLILLKINDMYNFFLFSDGTYNYIFFTFSAIIATLFFKTIIKITDNFAIKRLHIPDKKIESYRLLIHHIFSYNNIRFIIYILYLIFLCYYSIMMLEKNTHYLFDPILQSFLTYLALDLIIMDKKNVNFSPIEFFNKLGNAIE